jgi:hypothetical protein
MQCVTFSMIRSKAIGRRLYLAYKTLGLGRPALARSTPEGRLPLVVDSRQSIKPSGVAPYGCGSIHEWPAR